MRIPKPAEVIACGVVFPIVDGVLVALRLYARKGRVRFGLDDFFCLFSWLISLGVGALLITGSVKYGFGQVSPTTTSEAGFNDNAKLTSDTKRVTIFVNFLTVWALGSAKLSLLFFYRRIFLGKVFNIVSWATIAIVASWILTVFFLALLQCGPDVSTLWTSAKSVKAHCVITGERAALFYSSFDVVQDIFIFAIPVYWTSTLHMSRNRKLFVYGMFLFGLVAAVASIVRWIVYIKIYPGHTKTPNQLGYFTVIAYFSMLETGLAITASCLPTLGSLLSDRAKLRLSEYFTRLGSTTQRSKTKSGSHDGNESLTTPHSISLSHIHHTPKGDEPYHVHGGSMRASDEEASVKQAM